jgi:phosphoglucomutase
MNGQQEIAAMMEEYRISPPSQLGGSKVIQLLDYQKQMTTHLQTNKKEPITLPQSNVLQFVLEDGSKISARPSGTEPKIKFYFSVNARLTSTEQYGHVEKSLSQKIDAIIKDLNL